MSHPLPTPNDPARAYRVTDVTRGTTLAARASAGVTFWRRLAGLIGKTTLAEGEGLILPNCRSIHTWFMRLPIDVVVINREGQVLRCLEPLPPWRLAPHVRNAWCFIELRPGAIKRAGVREGDQLTLS